VGRVLVIDDRQADRDLLRTVLGSVGHRVLEAPGAEKALELARAERPDLILTDILMPTVNGYELVRQMRADPVLADTPVIFYSANYSEKEARALASACGVSRFLSKPSDPETILSVVSEVVNGATDSSPLSAPIDQDFDREHLRVLNDKLHQKVTELEAANGELRRSNADLEQFAYVASHDLSEPLRTVSGMVQLLARRCEGRLGEDADQYISEAVEGTRRMYALIQDLLLYARVGQGELSRDPVDCSKLVGRVAEGLRAVIQQSAATVSVGTLPTIRADATQLEQVFQNLVSNALKFRSAASPRVQVAAARDHRKWSFSVTDNGLGIEPRHARRVFEVFKRLHGNGAYPGSGIGLSICKRIVERHGGEIWVAHAPGGGCRFQFTIPDVDEDGESENCDPSLKLVNGTPSSDGFPPNGGISGQDGSTGG
jgi:signal transduction histidine kinase